MIDGLDKRIHFFSYEVKNEDGKYHFLPFMFKEAKNMYSSATWVNFDDNEKTKNVYGLIVFYDKDKKAIAHQEKKLKVTKKEPKPNSSIKKLSNKKNIVQLKKEKKLVIDVSKLKGKYSTFHSSLKPLTTKTALKQEVRIETTKKMSYDPRSGLSYEEHSNKKGKIHTMVIVYDKNLKPISYITASYNNADFIN